MKIKVMGMISNLSDGGAQRVLLNQAKMFANDEEIEFVIFSYEASSGSVYDKLIKENNINVVYLNQERHWCKIPLIGDFINLFVTNYQWYKAIREYKPDVVHTHVTEIMRKCVFAVQLSKVKHKYATLHSNPLRYKGLSLFFAKYAFNVVGFLPICLTEEQAKLATKRYGFKNYRIVRNGVDFEEIRKKIIAKDEAKHKFKIGKDSFVICSVGRLEEIKNISFILSIFPQILSKNNKVHYLVVGDGTQHEKLEKMAKELGIERYITFTGNIENTTEAYCAADVFCMPSISEASPMALHEAQFSKLKCVISKGIPLENIFSNNVTAVDIADKAGWINAILYDVRTVTPEREIEDFSVLSTANTLRVLYSLEGEKI